MALDPNTLKEDIVYIITNMPAVDENNTAEDNINLYAELLAQKLTEYIKTATVNVTVNGDPGTGTLS